MVRVFISYASEDRPGAERLAQALAQSGFAVWWDRKIPLGSSFDQVIEENLAQAECVLVLWTAASVQSRWVRAEASEAAAREVLVPVLMEPELKLPLEFRLLQAANLSDWSGDAQHAEFSALLAHITAIGGRAGAAQHDPGAAGAHAGMQPAARAHRPPGPLRARDSATQRGPRRPGLALMLLAPGVAILAAAVAATMWRVPTRLQLDLVVDRLAFTLAGERGVDMPVRPLGFRTLSVENFDRLTFTPDRVRWIAPGSSRMPPRSATVILNSPADAAAVAVVEGVGRGNSTAGAGRMQPLAIAPRSRVILATSADASNRVTLRVEGQPLDTNILPAAELALSATNVTLGESSPSAPADGPVALAFSLPEDRPFVQVQGTRRWFAITATLSASAALALLDRAGVNGVELLKQGGGGTVESAVIANGAIRYPQQPRIAPVPVGARDFVTLGDMSRTTITRLELSAEQSSMLLTMDGVATQATLASGGAERSLCITALQSLWHRSRVGVALLAAVCLASMLAGGYRLYEEHAAA
ncbi:MAG TPA: toll/interleukin-1 receptor domain-containing protein [Burkholderiales bacterium]|nr:toll/interleukin-1 receptor domain-containing protein [Burkholderiales bacterium]